MNSALTFLGIAAAIAVIGGVVVAVLHRDPEAASDDGVGQFQRIMDALAPDDAERVSGLRSDAARPGQEPVSPSSSAPEAPASDSPAPDPVALGEADGAEAGGAEAGTDGAR